MKLLPKRMGVCLLAALAVLTFQFRAVAVPKPIGAVSGSVVNSCAGSGNLTGDAGIPGITVSLSNATTATVTTTTAANGSFSFTNVVAGAYVLTVNPPVQYVETYPAGVTNNKVQVSVTPGQTTTTNFGYAFSSPPTIIYTPPVTSSIALGSQAECTATESQWAGAPSGTDAAAVLAANFATVFPSGLTIGYTGGFTVSLTSVPAVDAFLSSASGAPGSLSASAVNPASSSAGDFAGEVLALQLSVGFSGAGVFGTGTTLSNLVYYNPSSPLNGYGLDQILNIANIGLGGGNLAPYGVSIDDLETLVVNLNSALTNCTADAFAASSLLIPVSASDVTDSIISNAVTLVEAGGGASFTVSHTDTGTCGLIRTFTIQAMNTCGYESSSNVVFAIGSNPGAPVITGVPAGGFLGCVGAGQFPAGLPSESAIYGEVSATGLSGSPIIVVTLQDTVNGCSGSRTFTVTVSDICGNLASKQTTYTWDILSGVPTFGGLPAAATNYSCYAQVPPAAQITATDACGQSLIVNYSSTETAPGSLCNDIITRTWTAADCAGQTASFQQVITVENLIPPTMTAGTIASCYSSVEEATNAAVLATSASAACSGTVVLTVSTNGTNCPATITVTATDGCGNSTNVAYTTAILLTAPTFENPPANVTYSCYSDVPAMQPLTAVDACGTVWSVTGTSVETAPGSSCNDTITRTWTATDCAGQTTKIQQIITVKNLIPPTMTAGTIASCYSSVEEATNAAVLATSASAACSGTVVLTVSTNGTNCPATITVTATDGCGNSTNVTYTTAILLTAPTFENPPANVTYSCYSDVPAMQPLTAVDACGTVWSVTGTSVETAPGSSCNDTITRTWTATDCAGQTTKIQQIITVKNLIPPTMTAGTIASCYSSVEEATNAAVLATSASAACSGTVVLTVSTNGTNCPATITVTATDGCGNSTNVTYTTAILLTAPTFENPPANVTYSCYSDVPAMQPLTAMDACGTVWSVTGTSVETAPGSSCNDTITRTWTATDCAGQTTKIQQIITVKNLIPPTMTQGTIASCYSSVMAATNAAVQATKASAFCSGTVTLTVTTNGLDCPATITVTATDGCGNSAHVTYTAAILPIPPTFENPPANATYSCYSEVPALQPLTAVDACGTSWAVNGTSMQTAAGSSCNDIITRTWTATDCAGQTTTFIQTIKVDNTNAPTLAHVPTGGYTGCSAADLPTDATVLNGVTATDFCGKPASVTASYVDSVNNCEGTRTFSIVGTDTCGNTVTQIVACTWTAGTNGPNVVCPPSVTIVTNVCQMYCTFTPSDWGCAPNPGYNNNWGYVSQYYNNWGFGGGWGSCNWGNHDANNWWQSWCNTNPVSACWPSWTNWWSQSASPTNGNALWTTWCAQRPTNCWGSWSANNQSANNGNWWNGWNGGNQSSYGWVPCSGSNPGGVLNSCFNKVYSNGCVRIGSPSGNCWTFTSFSAVTNCLGFGGNCGVLTSCATNPASSKSGAFCAQVLALQLNCDFGDYGCVPGFFGKCGDLVLTCPTSPCNGSKVRDILSLCNGVLGGAPCPSGCTVSNLCGLLTNLNQCFEGCRVSPWCSSNLAQVYIPPTSVTGTATATATCSPVAILTNYDTIMPTSCSNTYVIERVWAAVDGCGNSNYCTQLITVAQSGLVPGAELTKTGPATATVSNTLVYTFTVTNNGNSTETLQVVDPLLGGTIFSQSNVAPGQGFAFSENYTPKTSGNLTNTAWAIGTVPGGKSVTNYSTAITCITTKCVTNQICSSFNSQNQGSGYVWFNAHLNCYPGKACAFYCSNATVTLSCADGKVYTFPVPNCQVNFTNCSSGSCSYNGSSWTTEIPSAGDSECFLSGFGIPWQADFANCHSVCWTGVFSCSTPGVSCNWQWSAACYNCSLSNCGAINVKPCHDNPCGYQNSDHAGTPENCTSHCQPGACGGGGGNYTGSWSGTGSFTCH